MHCAYSLDDGYLGSGLKLRNSIRKYGRENFKREIMEFLSSKEELADREAELVNDDLLNDPLCLNLKKGGIGGGKFFSEEHRKKCSDAGLNAFKEKIKTDEDLHKKYQSLGSQRMKDNWEKGKVTNFKWTGLHLSDDHKKKIGKKNKINQIGSGNSNYGMKWVYNPISNESKKIKPESLNEYLSSGWVIGRRMN
jgi:hypothetical protein